LAQKSDSGNTGATNRQSHRYYLKGVCSGGLGNEGVVADCSSSASSRNIEDPNQSQAKWWRRFC
jgi:hypothetical protein